MANNNRSMELLVSHLKEYGFVFPGSQIYGGLSNSWDYGPLGVAMKLQLKQLWWNYFIAHNPLNVGLDSAIIMNSQVWKASGHLDNFHDLFVDCKNCFKRFRVDHLVKDFIGNKQPASMEEWQNLLVKNQVKCPNCKAKDFTNVRTFDLMFKTQQGVLSGEQDDVYLRPETAQGIFINFKNVQRSLRKKLPFGIGQIGKAFRNEITPGHFIFRTREFEQMELEFFFNPEDKKDWFTHWINECQEFLRLVGIKKENISLKAHEPDNLAHYAAATTDIEYEFPFGKEELWGISNRTDFDLKNHSKFSKQDLSYMLPNSKEAIFPYVIEPSVGVDRLLLAILNDAFEIETLPDKSTRIVLRLITELAPYTIAVLPLRKEVNDVAFALYEELSNEFLTTYDETQSIGKRYRRQDAIGTPYCITYDLKTLKDKKVTIRMRDDMSQVRVKIKKISKYLQKLESSLLGQK